MVMEKDANGIKDSLWFLEKKKLHRLKISMQITYFFAILFTALFLLYRILKTANYWVNVILYYGSLILALFLIVISLTIILFYNRFTYNYRIIRFLKMGKKADQLLFIVTNDAKVDRLTYRRKHLALAALEDLNLVKVNDFTTQGALNVDFSNKKQLSFEEINIESIKQDVDKIPSEDFQPYKDTNGHFFSLFAISKEYFSENITNSMFAFGLMSVLFLALGFARFFEFGFISPNGISPITWLVLSPATLLELFVMNYFIKRSIKKIESMKDQKDYLGLLDKASRSKGRLFSHNALSAIGALGDLGIIESTDGLEQLSDAKSKYVRYLASTAIDMILIKNDLPDRHYFHL